MRKIYYAIFICFVPSLLAQPNMNGGTDGMAGGDDHFQKCRQKLEMYKPEAENCEKLGKNDQMGCFSKIKMRIASNPQHQNCADVFDRLVEGGPGGGPEMYPKGSPPPTMSNSPAPGGPGMGTHPQGPAMAGNHYEDCKKKLEMFKPEADSCEKLSPNLRGNCYGKVEQKISANDDTRSCMDVFHQLAHQGRGPEGSHGGPMMANSPESDCRNKLEVFKPEAEKCGMMKDDKSREGCYRTIEMKVQKDHSSCIGVFHQLVRNDNRGHSSMPIRSIASQGNPQENDCQKKLEVYKPEADKCDVIKDKAGQDRCFKGIEMKVQKSHPACMAVFHQLVSEGGDDRDHHGDDKEIAHMEKCRPVMQNFDKKLKTCKNKSCMDQAAAYAKSKNPECGEFFQNMIEERQ